MASEQRRVPVAERFVKMPDCLLGTGATKVVYKGYDKEEVMEVAWNEIQLLRLDSDTIKKLETEILLLRQLRHPSLIRSLASWLTADNSTLIIITELMTSGTLHEYIVDHHCHLKPSAMIAWACQIASGLAYLHSRTPKVIHRDLKCDNLFINGQTGVVKIGDLGISRRLNETDIKRKGGLTVIGTPEFMAPECYDGKYDEKCDIWAFGLCVVEMATGETPYSECQNGFKVYEKVKTKVLPDVYETLRRYATEGVDVPGTTEEKLEIRDGYKELFDIASACLRFDPSERPSAAELLMIPIFAPFLEEFPQYKITQDICRTDASPNIHGSVSGVSMKPTCCSRPHSAGRSTDKVKLDNNTFLKDRKDDDGVTKSSDFNRTGTHATSSSDMSRTPTRSETITGPTYKGAVTGTRPEGNPPRPSEKVAKADCPEVECAVESQDLSFGFGECVGGEGAETIALDIGEEGYEERNDDFETVGERVRNKGNGASGAGQTDKKISPDRGSGSLRRTRSGEHLQEAYDKEHTGQGSEYKERNEHIDALDNGDDEEGAKQTNRQQDQRASHSRRPPPVFQPSQARANRYTLTGNEEEDECECRATSDNDVSHSTKFTSVLSPTPGGNGNRRRRQSVPRKSRSGKFRVVNERGSINLVTDGSGIESDGQNCGAEEDNCGTAATDAPRTGTDSGNMSYSASSDNECGSSTNHITPAASTATGNSIGYCPMNGQSPNMSPSLSSSTAAALATTTPNSTHNSTNPIQALESGSSADLSDIPPNVVMLEGISEGVDETGSVVTVRIDLHLDNGTVTTIHFPFDVNQDDAHDLANEMLAEFEGALSVDPSLVEQTIVAVVDNAMGVGETEGLDGVDGGAEDVDDDVGNEYNNMDE